MATLLESVAKTAQKRAAADEAFRAALVAAKEVHSWAEIANAAGMSRGGVIHLTQNTTKGEK